MIKNFLVLTTITQRQADCSSGLKNGDTELSVLFLVVVLSKDCPIVAVRKHQNL